MDKQKQLNDALEQMFGNLIASTFNKKARTKNQPIQYMYVLKQPLLIHLN